MSERDIQKEIMLELGKFPGVRIARNDQGNGVVGRNAVMPMPPDSSPPIRISLVVMSLLTCLKPTCNSCIMR